MNSVTAALSLGGWVLGMQQTAVKPPATAAAVPLAMVSLYSNPGSRRCTWAPIKPGATTRPVASNTWASLSSIRSARRAIFPSAIRTLRPASKRCVGSITRPCLISSRLTVSSRQEVENCHAHRHAVGHLLKDHRLGPVGHSRVDLHAAVHRPGVHDQAVPLRELQPLGGECKEVVVLPDRREVHPPLPLELDAQHHHDIGAGNRVLHPPVH